MQRNFPDFGLSLFVLTLSFGLLFPGVISAVSAAEFFVDSENGCDSNSGTSPQEAWKSLERVNHQKYEPGDTVRFRRNGLWRGNVKILQSGKKGAPITFTSYGKGTLKPRIWASRDLCSPKCWIPAEGLENVWVTLPDQVKRTGEFKDFLSGKWSKYQDGIGKADLKVTQNANGAESLSLTCLQPGERDTNIQLNYIPFKLGAKQTFVLRFRAKASKPFTVSANSWKCMRARSPWNAYGSVFVRDVELTDKWQEFEVQVNSTLLETAEDARLSLFIGKAIPRDCVFSLELLEAVSAECTQNSLPYEVGNIILVKKGGTPVKELKKRFPGEETGELAAWKYWKLEDLKKQGDFFYEPQTGRVYFYSIGNPVKHYVQMEAAQKLHIFQYTGEYITVEDISCAYSGAHGVSGGTNCRHCVVRNCEFLWIGGSWLYTRGPIPTRYGNGVQYWNGAEDVLVEKNYFLENYDTAMTNQGPEAGILKGMVWKDNVCVRCEQCYEIWYTHPEMTVKSLRVNGNVCIDTGKGWSHAQRPNKNGVHLLAYGMNCGIEDISYSGNVFGDAETGTLWFSNERVKEFRIDRNRFESKRNPPKFIWRGNDGVDLETWRKVTGNDLNSTVKSAD